MISFKIDVQDNGNMGISKISKIEDGVETDITSQLINPEEYTEVMTDLFTPAGSMKQDWYRMNSNLGKVLKNLCLKANNIATSSSLRNEETGKFHPTNLQELKTVILNQVNELGMGANLNVIDVSQITDFSGVFSYDYGTDYDMRDFDGDISQWDVSNAVKMDSMFEGSNCNCDLSNWNTSNVVTMSYMFNKANGRSIQSIENWNVSNVKDFSYALQGDWYNKNGMDINLGNWDVSNAENMNGMLADNRKFTGKGLENWNVSKVVTMDSMFLHDDVFQGNISNWNVSNVQNMSKMFAYCESFNRPLNWTTSSLVNASSMFWNALSFNQDISNWDVRNIVDAESMFSQAKSFSQDLSNWRFDKLEKASLMFYETNVNFDASHWMDNRKGVKKGSFTYTFDGCPIKNNLPDWWYKLTRHKRPEVRESYIYSAYEREKFTEDINKMMGK